MIAFIAGFITGVCACYLIYKLREADKNIGLD